MSPDDYKRKVICWFKAVLTSDQRVDTRKLKRMKKLYPKEYMQACRELYKS